MEDDAGSNKKKAKENDVNLDDAFMRFEFLELVMRMAMKFPQTADPKAGPRSPPARRPHPKP